jgi:hypothetical protein
LSESERPKLVERFVRLVLREALGGIAKPAEHFVKRLARSVGLIIAGIVVSVIGIGFVSVGAVKWLSALMPAWLAWIIVGVILLLLGSTVAMATLASGR